MHMGHSSLGANVRLAAAGMPGQCSLPLHASNVTLTEPKLKIWPIICSPVRSEAKVTPYHFNHESLNHKYSKTMNNFCSILQLKSSRRLPPVVRENLTRTRIVCASNPDVTSLKSHSGKKSTGDALPKKVAIKHCC